MVDIGSDIAGTQYDVAYVRWKGSWHIPTRDQSIELIKNCTVSQVSQNGVKCTKFVGNNGGYIIMPHNNGQSSIVNTTVYWNSNIYPTDATYAYSFGIANNGYNWTWYYAIHRYSGLPIRPVSE